MDQFMRINLERDMNELVKFIKGYMTKTYINDLTREVSKCEEICSHNQSREVQLIEALIPFLPIEKRGMLEKVGQMLRYEQVVDLMLPKILTSHSAAGMRQENNEQLIQEIIIKALLFKLMDTMENR